MLSKESLKVLYIDKKLSANEIADYFKCSSGKVNYWLKKFDIPKRSISEAIYKLKNPKGDPFQFNKPENMKGMFLFGLGLGLYWGEGAKRSMHSVRLSNSDPALVKKFIEFLVAIYNIDKKKLKFQLQIYDDLNAKKLLHLWSDYLKAEENQFYKTIVLKRRGQGTYNKRMKYGVIILNFGNTKLINLICSQIANLQNL